MILESKEMFSSLLSFYRFQVADFLKMNYNSIKKEKLCQDKTFCYWLISSWFSYYLKYVNFKRSK